MFSFKCNTINREKKREKNTHTHEELKDNKNCENEKYDAEIDGNSGGGDDGVGDNDSNSSRRT